MACEVIKRHNLTATILVPNNILLSQFKATLEDLFGVEPGIVNGSKKEIKDITIATWQTLSSNPDLLKELAAQTSVLISDEVHGSVTLKKLEILRKFSPKHIYGLTATPSRGADDGRTPAIFFHFGEVIAEYHQTQHKPTVEVKTTGAVIDYNEYHLMIDQLVGDKNRNTLIAGIALGEAASGRRVLVLTKRIAHYENIREILGERDNVYYISSKDKNRNKLLMDMRNGDVDFKIIFGTTSLLAVGMDVPSLDTLIIACDLKAENLTIQACGFNLNRGLVLATGSSKELKVNCTHVNQISLKQRTKR